MTTKGQDKGCNSMSMACTVPSMLSVHIDRSDGLLMSRENDWVEVGAPMEIGWSCFGLEEQHKWNKVMV